MPLLSFVNKLIYKGNATEDKTSDLRKITVSLNDGLKTFTLQENNHFVYSQYGDKEDIKALRVMERIKALSKEVELSGKSRR